jgi:hypothetical protein
MHRLKEGEVYFLFDLHQLILEGQP